MGLRLLVSVLDSSHVRGDTLWAIFSDRLAVCFNSYICFRTSAQNKVGRVARIKFFEVTFWAKY